MTLNVSDAIKNRRATRKYTDQEVTDEVLDRVVNLALEAPTAFNAQRPASRNTGTPQWYWSPSPEPVNPPT